MEKTQTEFKEGTYEITVYDIENAGKVTLRSLIRFKGLQEILPITELVKDHSSNKREGLDVCERFKTRPVFVIKIRPDFETISFGKFEESGVDYRKIFTENTTFPNIVLNSIVVTI